RLWAGRLPAQCSYRSPKRPRRRCPRWPDHFILRFHHMQAAHTKKPGGMPTRPVVCVDCGGSADRRRILQAAFGPQTVQPARNLERRALADILFKHLAVVPDVLDNAIAPVLGEAELFAIIALGAEQALYIRVGRLHLLVDIGLGDPKLLG